MRFFNYAAEIRGAPGSHRSSHCDTRFCASARAVALVPVWMRPEPSLENAKPLRIGALLVVLRSENLSLCARSGHSSVLY